MQAFSIIILAKNEKQCIQGAVKSALTASTDVIVVDSGSTDGTIEIASDCGARVIQIDWQGYGQARNEGAGMAIHDQVFCLDADEVITSELAAWLQTSQPDPATIYGFNRRNFLGRREVRYGEWGHNTVYRYYNRRFVRWNNNLVHESLEPVTRQKKKIPHSLLHYTTASLKEYNKKLILYSQLAGENYFVHGKKSGLVRRLTSTGFNFLKNYIVRLGFLDGKLGLDLAIMHANYNWRKYSILMARKKTR